MSVRASPKPYLRYWIGCQDFVLNSRLASRFADHSKVPHGVSSRHRFTSSRLTTDDDGLVFVVPKGKGPFNTHRSNDT